MNARQELTILPAIANTNTAMCRGSFQSTLMMPAAAVATTAPATYNASLSLDCLGVMPITSGDAISF